MNERQKRLIEVFEHLRKYFGVYNKTKFAEAVKFGRTSMSAALNGNEDYLTDKFFKSICNAYPGVFNIDYLLNGDGELLTVEEQVRIGEIEERFAAPSTDIPEYVQKLCDEAARVSTKCEMLEQNLSVALADNRELKEQLKTALASVDGMKQQLAQVIHIFSSPKTVQQWRESYASEQTGISPDVNV